MSTPFEVLRRRAGSQRLALDRSNGGAVPPRKVYSRVVPPPPPAPVPQGEADVAIDSPTAPSSSSPVPKAPSVLATVGKMKEAVHVCPRFAPTRDKHGTPLVFEASSGDLSISTNTETQDGKADVEHRRYKFAHVFQPDTTEDELFSHMWTEAFSKLKQGYHATILCYGQTGSGKTHTVNNMLPRMTEACFEWLRGEGSDYTVQVCYLQIYLDSVYDLLSGTKADKRGEVLDHKGKTLDALPKRYVQVTTAAEAVSLVKKGSRWRATNQHALNDRSSRSHTLYFLTIVRNHAESGSSIESTLLLVDLAGSERAHKTKASGEVFQEGKAINKALTTLGRVMEALSKGDKSVPYRENILTMYLKETLTNSFFALICCCSSDGRDADETRCTLKFGSVAKNVLITRKANELIKLRAVAREKKQEHARELTEMAKHHHEQIRQLQKQMQEHEANRTHWKEKVSAMEQQLERQRAKLTGVETAAKDLADKLSNKEADFESTVSALTAIKERYAELVEEVKLEQEARVAAEATTEALRAKEEMASLRAEEFERALAEKQREIDETTSMMQRAQTEVSGKQHEIDEALSSMQRVQADLVGKQKELAEVRQQMAEAAEVQEKHLLQREMELADEIGGKERCLEAAQHTVQRLNEEHQALREELALVQQELDAVRSQLETMQEELADAKRLAAHIKSDRDHKSEMASRYQSEAKRLAAAVHERESEAESLRKEAEAVHRKADAEVKQVRRLQRLLTQQQDEKTLTDVLMLGLNGPYERGSGIPRSAMEAYLNAWIASPRTLNFATWPEYEACVDKAQEDEDPYGLAAEPDGSDLEDDALSICPRNTSECPRNTSECPRNTSERPRNTPECPRNTSERPRNTSERPRNTSERPRNTPECPRNTSERPRNTSERPRNTPECPRNTSERPRNTSERNNKHAYRMGIMEGIMEEVGIMKEAGVEIFTITIDVRSNDDVLLLLSLFLAVYAQQKSEVFRGRSEVFRDRPHRTYPGQAAPGLPGSRGNIDRTGSTRQPKQDRPTGRQGKVFRGRSEVFRGRSEVFWGHSEVFRGHSEVFRGRSEVFWGHSEVFWGHSEVFRGRFKLFRGRSKSDTRFLAAFVNTRNNPYNDDGHAERRRNAIQLFWKRNGKKVTDGRTKCGIDTKNVADDGTGVIYVLVNEGGTALYVGQTSKTAETRNNKHWENRNSKRNRVAQQLRKRGRKLYACPIQNVPERLYTQPADFPRVALPIEDFWIKWLNPPLNMTNRRQGEKTSHLDGHALGLATDLKTDEALLSLFRKGRKYRVASSPMSLYDSMRFDVEEFVTNNFRKSSESEKSHFAATLTEEFDTVLGTLNAHTDEPHLRDALRTLKKLQEHLVILPVDKTAHDFGFICKEKYKELIRKELHQSSAYKHVDTSMADILQQHQTFNKSHNFTHSNILPYLYGTPKLHKPEPRMRYIAGVSEKGNTEKTDEQQAKAEKTPNKKQPKTRASTTPAHQETSGILKLVLATLQGKDEASRAKTGIRRFFVVESIDGVAVHIKTNYARLRQKVPRTFDFKEMYTKIPQQRIVEYVMLAVSEAFEYAKAERGCDLKARRSKQQFEFSNADAMDATAYNVEEIRELVEFIVGNTFVTNGGQCYQQVTGIPMGGNASPDLANLYCYWCEKLYIDSLITEGRHEEARAHADSVRFIDDFLTWSARPPPEAIYGMEYSETSKDVDDVVFLGMRVRVERGNKANFIRLSVLDKGEEFPWYPIKYTHAESTVPRNTGTSIFKGALIRAARICNNMPDLKVEIMKDLKALLAFCLANTYVLVNGTLMRQILGIPMGANASPDIANLFCYAKEKRYMLKLLAEKEIRRATLLSMTRRFIDDLLCFGTKPPPESIYSMRYKQTNTCVGDSTFLGIRIRHEVSDASGRRYMRLSVLDKAKAYPYRPLAYTSVLSTAPSNFGSSILIGALVRNGRIANNLYDFKTEMNNTGGFASSGRAPPDAITILATPWAIEKLKRWKRSWQAAEAVRSSRRAFARAMCRSSVIAPGHQAPNAIADREVAVLESGLVQAEHKVEAAETEAARKHRRISDLESEVREERLKYEEDTLFLQAHIDTLETRQVDGTRDKQRLQHGNEELRTKIEAMQREAESTKVQLECDIKNLREDLQNERKSLHHTKAESFRIQEQNLDMEVELCSLKSSMEGQLRRMEDLREQDEEHHDRVLSQLQRLLQEVQKERDDVQEEVGELRTQLQILQQKYLVQLDEANAARADQQRLRGRVDTSESHLAKEKAVGDALNGELKRLASALESQALTEEEKNILEEEVQVTREQLADSAGTISLMEKELQVLVQRHEAAVSLSDTQTKKCAELSDDCLRGMKELRGARSEIEAQAKNVQVLQKTNERMLLDRRRLVHEEAKIRYAGNELRGREEELKRLQSYQVKATVMERKLTTLGAMNQRLAERTKAEAMQTKRLAAELAQRDRELQAITEKYQKEKLAKKREQDHADARIKSLEEKVVQLRSGIEKQSTTMQLISHSLKETERERWVLKHVLDQKDTFDFIRKGTGIQQKSSVSPLATSTERLNFSTTVPTSPAARQASTSSLRGFSHPPSRSASRSPNGQPAFDAPGRAWPRHPPFRNPRLSPCESSILGDTTVKTVASTDTSASRLVSSLSAHPKPGNRARRAVSPTTSGATPTSFSPKARSPGPSTTPPPRGWRAVPPISGLSGTVSTPQYNGLTPASTSPAPRSGGLSTDRAVSPLNPFRRLISKGTLRGGSPGGVYSQASTGRSADDSSSARKPARKVYASKRVASAAYGRPIPVAILRPKKATDRSLTAPQVISF
ncbi:Kinesin-like protein 3 [Diplonema papillatum]|nr:Kinesin-like protein 3 [Diplonema papillatum]